MRICCSVRKIPTRLGRARLLYLVPKSTLWGEASVPNDAMDLKPLTVKHPKIYFNILLTCSYYKIFLWHTSHCEIIQLSKHLTEDTCTKKKQSSNRVSTKNSFFQLYSNFQLWRALCYCKAIQKLWRLLMRKYSEPCQCKSMMLVITFTPSNCSQINHSLNCYLRQSKLLVLQNALIHRYTTCIPLHHLEWIHSSHSYRAAI